MSSDQSGGNTEQPDIERFIERNREALEGNPTEYARGYETCLDRLEELVDSGEEAP